MNMNYSLLGLWTKFKTLNCDRYILICVNWSVWTRATLPAVLFQQHGITLAVGHQSGCNKITNDFISNPTWLMFNICRNTNVTTSNPLMASPSLACFGWIHLYSRDQTTFSPCYFSCMRRDLYRLLFTVWNTFTVITQYHHHRPQTLIILFSSHK